MLKLSLVHDDEPSAEDTEKRRSFLTKCAVGPFMAAFNGSRSTKPLFCLLANREGDGFAPMDLYFFVEGPLLWVCLSILLIGILARLAFFFSAIFRSDRNKGSRWRYDLATMGRFFLPFHKGAGKRPVYAAIRYIFHGCLFVVPIWLSGHVTLWAESRFEWEWPALPDVWADGMTLLLLALGAYFVIRRATSSEDRTNSSRMDYVLIVITALPFLTGYFLAHGSLDAVAFLGDNMALIHMLSGEAMIVMAVFLFVGTRLNPQTCTGCAACEVSCPTGTLESCDEGKFRIFKYSHYQCIYCGSCVNACPEDAAALRHELSPRRFFQIVPKREIRAVELQACERCGARFAPEPQMGKVGKTFSDDYLRFCPRCRMTNMGDFYRRLSPWHKGAAKTHPLGDNRAVT
jgi:ferredoxin